MSALPPPYEPTTRFTNVNQLLGNHFRFQLEALPDLTQFAQSITIPSVISGAVPRATPLTRIQETGDTLAFGSLTVSYIIDNGFKSYTSLFWWMKGYGFPHTNEEVENFRQIRASRIATPRPLVRDLEKTNATLWILEPDTERALVEIRFSDVFPTTLGELSFSTTDGDAPNLATSATFACTEFDVFPA
jgi:hypothetical protein